MHKMFPLHAILTMRTGICMGDFGKAHELAEWVLGHPVWTHELASGGTVNDIKAELATQFPGLPGKMEGVTPDTVEGILKELEEKYGKELSVAKGGAKRTSNPLETLMELVGDRKPVIAVAV